MQLNDNRISTKADVSCERQAGYRGKALLLNMHVHCSFYFPFLLPTEQSTCLGDLSQSLLVVSLFGREMLKTTFKFVWTEVSKHLMLY